MKTRLLPLLLVMFTLSSNAQNLSRAAYLQAFDERAAFATSTYDTSSSVDFGSIAVRYAHHHDIATADSMFRAILVSPQNDMFWMYQCINAYMYGKDLMSQSTRNVVRNAWKTYAPYRGDTENHWAMYYASLFIAAEQWPNLSGSEWYNGKSSAENLADARSYLIHWMTVTTTIGQGEFDSSWYIAEYINALQPLAAFALDPEMKKRGVMMLDYILADFAVEHLDGQYLGGSSRNYEPAVYEPMKSTASAFAWLYFGRGEPTHSGWVTYSALSSYRLPQIVYHIATDRSRPYVEKERKRVRNVIRFGPELNPPVYKYTYVTKDYGIGSLQGGILQPIQQHTWGVQFTVGRPFTTIFGLHPYWSERELGMFFPGELKPMIADVVASKHTYDNPDKWTSSSPYERTFQHRNTLLVLYDIPAGTTSDHIDGFFPANLDERVVDVSGWIICRAGDTYVGWYPLQPYEWIPEIAGTQWGKGGKPAEEGSSPDYFRLRSSHLQNGCVIEVRSRSGIGSFRAFSHALRRHIPHARLDSGSVALSYTTLNGDSMSFDFPDKRILNGTPVDLSTTKLFDGPYLHADVGSEALTMTYKHEKLVLDFRKVAITE